MESTKQTEQSSPGGFIQPATSANTNTTEYSPRPHHETLQLQQQQQQFSVDNGQSAGYCSRLRASIGQPERLQPTILAISLTYIAYQISVVAGLLPEQPAASQFTYYCCIVGAASAIAFYLKFHCNCNHPRIWMLIYNLLLVLLLLLYVAHWFVKPKCKYAYYK